MPKKEEDYRTLSDELDTVIADLSKPDVAVDETVELYKKGMDLVTRLEDHVKHAENTLEKVRLQFGEES